MKTNTWQLHSHSSHFPNARPVSGRRLMTGLAAWLVLAALAQPLVASEWVLDMAMPGSGFSSVYAVPDQGGETVIVAIQAGDTDVVSLVRGAPGNWTVEQVAVSPAGYDIRHASPGVYPDGSVAVGYTQYYWDGSAWSGELRLATRDDDGWSTRILASGQPHGLAMAVAADGGLWAAYEVPAGGHWSYKRVMVGLWDGTTFAVDDVDATLSYGSTPALTLGPAGRPHVAYISYITYTWNAKVKHATRRPDGSWDTAIATTPGTKNVFDIGIAVGPGGEPHICYGNGAGLYHTWEGDVGWD